MSQKQVDYKKKMQICEMLGAKTFKKVVLNVEKVKWTVLKKVCPDFLKRYEKQCEHNLRKTLSKAKTDEEKEQIRSYYRHQILLARKEFNHEQNRNYHINATRPTDIIRYLEWNKEIHQNGLIKNIMVSLIAFGFVEAGIGTELAATLIGLQAIDSVINFQCINLQNYNICRIETHKEALERREARRVESAAKKYGEAAKVIDKAFTDTKEESRIPTPEEIVARIDNPEQLRQIKKMIESAKNTYKAPATDAGVKGGTKK